MKFIKRKILGWLYPVALLYWWIFRPKTFGAKIILRSGNEILMVRHSYAGGNWTFPGGGLKRGETPEGAVRREVKEELGFNLAIEPKLIGELNSRAEYKIDTIYVFLVDVDKFGPAIDHQEIIEAQWFDFESLPNLSTINRKIISFLPISLTKNPEV